MGRKCCKPNSGGIYNNIGYLTIDPPIPTIPEMNDPANPIRNNTNKTIYYTPQENPPWYLIHKLP